MSDYVLDILALLALDGAVISAVDLAEVVTRLTDRGVAGQEIRRQLARLDLGVAPVDEDLAYAAGVPRPLEIGLAVELVAGSDLVDPGALPVEADAVESAVERAEGIWPRCSSDPFIRPTTMPGPSSRRRSCAPWLRSA